MLYLKLSMFIKVWSELKFGVLKVEEIILHNY